MNTAKILKARTMYARVKRKRQGTALARMRLIAAYIQSKRTTR